MENLFDAWFPELQDVCVIEKGEGKEYKLYGYEGYTSLWHNLSAEELYNCFENKERELEELARKAFIKGEEKTGD